MFSEMYYGMYAVKSSLYMCDSDALGLLLIVIVQKAWSTVQIPRPPETTQTRSPVPAKARKRGQQNGNQVA